MSSSEEKNPKNCTGPRTPEGKRAASRNATTHGLCSQVIILPGEDESEFRALHDRWLSEYDLDEPQILALAEHAAIAEWLFNRGTRRFHEAEQALYAEQPDPLLWTGEQHKKLERFLRYRTTHERAFWRALNNIQRLVKDFHKTAKECSNLTQGIAEYRMRNEIAQAKFKSPPTTPAASPDPLADLPDPADPRLSEP